MAIEPAVVARRVARRKRADKSDRFGGNAMQTILASSHHHVRVTTGVYRSRPRDHSASGLPPNTARDTASAVANIAVGECYFAVLSQCETTNGWSAWVAKQKEGVKFVRALGQTVL
jgi:hypothetical protein